MTRKSQFSCGIHYFLVFLLFFLFCFDYLASFSWICFLISRTEDNPVLFVVCKERNYVSTLEFFLNFFLILFCVCVCVIELVDLEMRTACFLDFEILHLFFFSLFC